MYDYQSANYAKLINYSTGDGDTSHDQISGCHPSRIYGANHGRMADNCQIFAKVEPLSS
jgi:hypothetical protein